jgi:hypothetical protein
VSLDNCLGNIPLCRLFGTRLIENKVPLVLLRDILGLVVGNAVQDENAKLALVSLSRDLQIRNGGMMRVKEMSGV